MRFLVGMGITLPLKGDVGMKNHCGSDECEKDPYSDDACECHCSRCATHRDERESDESRKP